MLTNLPCKIHPILGCLSSLTIDVKNADLLDPPFQSLYPEKQHE